MKQTNSFLIFLVLSLNSIAQVPELIYARSLSVPGSNQLDQRVFGLALDSADNLFAIASFGSVYDIGLEGVPLIIEQNNDEQFAILVKFIDDQYSLGGFGYRAAGRIESGTDGLVVTGRANAFSNFNFSTTMVPPFNLFDENSLGFVCRYDFMGFPFWALFASSSFADTALSNERIYTAISFCTACTFQDGLGDIIEFDNLSGDTVLIVVNKNNGQTINYLPLISNGDIATISVDHDEILNEVTYALEVGGNVDAQWEGATPVSVEIEGKSGVVLSYNEALEGSFLLTLSPNGFNPEFNRARWVSYDENHNLYCLLSCSQGSYTLNVNDLEMDVSVSSPLEYILLKLDSNKRLCWIKNYGTNGLSDTREIYLDQSGFLYFSGAYNEFLISSSEDLQLQDPLVPDAGFITSLTPEGETIWIHSISNGNISNVHKVVVTKLREMYIGGGFQAFSTDFDFDPNVSLGLGNANSYDPFIAKYQLPEITPDLFVSKRYEGVGVSEDGQADLIRLRLSRVPESSVTVELTPDGQLNLGNGVGVPIILEFAADQSAILEQVVNIDALNDLVVEGLHTGLISISMTSADPAFNNLSESPISVSIIDNDVMSVEERNEFGFSMSPNPASNFIDITCSQKPEGISLIEIIDIQGKKAYSQNFVSNTTRIDLSQFSKGTYSILVRAEDRVIWREGVIIR